MWRIAGKANLDATSAPSRIPTHWAATVPLFRKWLAARQDAQFQAGMDYWNGADPMERAFVESEPQAPSAFERGILAARDAERSRRDHS